MDKVSIVIPFYNCPYIEHSIESAIQQTYENVEVIVVNDGSTKHVEKIKPYMNQIKYIEKANGGTGSALNAGIRNASGNYFCWLSSDDIFYFDKVKIQLERMKQFNAMACYTNYYAINTKGEVISGLQGVYKPDRLEFLKTMRLGNIINGCTVMLNMNLFSEFGLFDEQLPYTHDYDLWVRVLEKYDFMYINEPLLLYRDHSEMGTRKHWDSIQQEINLVQKKNNFFINQLIDNSINEKKKDNLPPFLVTSVPKSGTYLLHQILTGMPGITSEHDMKKRFFTNSCDFNDYSQDHLERLKLLQKNEFGVGHVRYTKNYADMLEKLNMKHIFIYRDPRDVLVSMSYYIANVWAENPLHKDFHTVFKTPKQRQLALLNGIANKWEDFYTYNLPYYQWLNEKRSFHISFEDIISSESSRKTALKNLVQFLWSSIELPVPLEEIVRTLETSINPHTAVTFRSGKVGSWKNEFDEELIRTFKEKAGDLLIHFGFEKDNNW
ncbi:glycosyltransferase [Priestia megaterium]|uniref:glycosyltransferase n=1 Tax=Priestia megaterium TaxID=1404 RepID=UPI0036720F77